MGGGGRRSQGSLRCLWSLQAGWGQGGCSRGPGTPSLFPYPPHQLHIGASLSPSPSSQKVKNFQGAVCVLGGYPAAPLVSRVVKRGTPSPPGCVTHCSPSSLWAQSPHLGHKGAGLEGNPSRPQRLRDSCESGACSGCGDPPWTSAPSYASFLEEMGSRPQASFWTHHQPVGSWPGAQWSPPAGERPWATCLGADWEGMGGRGRVLTFKAKGEKSPRGCSWAHGPASLILGISECEESPSTGADSCSRLCDLGKGTPLGASISPSSK